MLTTKMNKRYKRGALVLFVLLLAGGAVLWYFVTEKFADTNEVKADYTVNALDLIKEFKTDIKLANIKYSEKTVVVNGIVSEVEAADTTANIKIIDTTNGAYIIFAFQQQHIAEAKQMKVGDSVSIKGSCSGGSYSEILETENINFKRCALNK